MSAAAQRALSPRLSRGMPSYICGRRQPAGRGDMKSPQPKAVLRLPAVTLVIVLLCRHPAAERRTTMPNAPASTGKHRTYTTHFRRAENPISEGGHWINGRTLGLDWADVHTRPGLAFGTEAGTIKYDDATALLKGTWGPNQTAEATVYTVNQKDDIYEE